MKIQPNKKKFNDSKYFETFDTVSIRKPRDYQTVSISFRTATTKGYASVEFFVLFCFSKEKKKGGGNREKVRSWLLHTQTYRSVIADKQKKRDTEAIVAGYRHGIKRIFFFFVKYLILFVCVYVFSIVCLFV